MTFTRENRFPYSNLNLKGTQSPTSNLKGMQSPTSNLEETQSPTSNLEEIQQKFEVINKYIEEYCKNNPSECEKTNTTTILSMQNMRNIDKYADEIFRLSKEEFKTKYSKILKNSSLLIDNFYDIIHDFPDSKTFAEYVKKFQEILKEMPIQDSEKSPFGVFGGDGKVTNKAIRRAVIAGFIFFALAGFPFTIMYIGYEYYKIKKEYEDKEFQRKFFTRDPRDYYVSPGATTAPNYSAGGKKLLYKKQKQTKNKKQSGSKKYRKHRKSRRYRKR